MINIPLVLNKAFGAQGGELRASPVHGEIECQVTESERILGLDIAGVVLLLNGKYFKICETNSSTGFKSLLQCFPVSIPGVTFDFIQVRLGLFHEKYSKK